MRTERASPIVTAATLIFLPALVACGTSQAGGPGENVQVQTDSYFFYQDFWRNRLPLPRAELTGPNNSETYTFNLTSIGTKSGWHKYKFALQAGDEVRLRVYESFDAAAPIVFERVCTVHPRAVDLTYAEIIAYGRVDQMDEDGNPLPPGPNAWCGCGFVEYGDQRNANQCS